MTPLPINAATALLLLFLLALTQSPITKAQDESTPTGEIKCGSCGACPNPCPQSPPPPSPPPPPPMLYPSPPPPSPKKPPSSRCPPPPAPYIYITGPPGDLYPVDPYFYNPAGRVAAGLVALVGSTLFGLVVGFW